jgi:hypothetical protein
VNYANTKVNLKITQSDNTCGHSALSNVQVIMHGAAKTLAHDSHEI